jgi:hypothetical protein
MLCYEIKDIIAVHEKFIFVNFCYLKEHLLHGLQRVKFYVLYLRNILDLLDDEIVI